MANIIDLRMLTVRVLNEVYTYPLSRDNMEYLVGAIDKLLSAIHDELEDYPRLIELADMLGMTDAEAYRREQKELEVYIIMFEETRDTIKKKLEE